MRRLFVLSAILVASIFAAEASASLQVGTKVKMDTDLPGGRGGQFGVIDPGNVAGKGFSYFITFCAELSQTITDNGKYYVNAISSLGNSSGKTLGSQAAYLYTQFRNGLISVPTDALSNALQYGIWQGMGYTHAQIQAAIGNSTANSYQTAWNNNKGVSGVSGWLQTFNTWSGIGNVRVMQLGDTINGPPNRQDQLVIVPEASTIAVWSILTLVGAGVAYRKSLQR